MNSHLLALGLPGPQRRRARRKPASRPVRPWWVAVLCAAIASPALAQSTPPMGSGTATGNASATAPAAAISLTLSQAYQAALGHDAVYRAAGHEVEYTRLGVPLARAFDAAFGQPECVEQQRAGLATVPQQPQPGGAHPPRLRSATSGAADPGARPQLGGAEQLQDRQGPDRGRRADLQRAVAGTAGSGCRSLCARADGRRRPNGSRRAGALDRTAAEAGRAAPAAR
jgi:hypothetical protein